MTRKKVNSPKIGRSINYLVFIILGVFTNILFILTAFLTYPTFDAFFYIEFLLPVPVTFLYCFLASTQTKERETVSPVYVMVGNLPAVSIVGSLMIYGLFSTDIPRAVAMVLANLYFVILFYILWILFGFILHRIVRGLIGAYSERGVIESSVLSYTTSKLPNDIAYQIEDEKWLVNVCSLKTSEKTEKENMVEIRLNKLETIFYLAISAGRVGKSTFVNIIPHQISENLVRKDITVTDECKEALHYQIEEIEKKLELKKIPQKNAKLVPESVNYAIYPSRFPALIKYKHSITVTIIAFIIVVFSLAMFLTKTIEMNVFLSILTITITTMLTIINLITRKF